MNVCRESVTGIHGRTDVQGRCLLCRRKVDDALAFAPDPSRRRQMAHAQNPLSIDGPDEADYLDGWDR